MSKRASGVPLGWGGVILTGIGSDFVRDSFPAVIGGCSANRGEKIIEVFGVQGKAGAIKVECDRCFTA